VLEQYPRSRIDVFIEILQADGSTRVASLTAASWLWPTPAYICET